MLRILLSLFYLLKIPEEHMKFYNKLMDLNLTEYFLWGMPNNKALGNAKQILSTLMSFVNSEDGLTVKIWHISHQAFYIVPQQLEHY